jgi:hypothetical protein
MSSKSLAGRPRATASATDETGSAITVKANATNRSRRPSFKQGSV